MIRTLAITVLCGLAASPAALATPDPTALGASIDKATPKKANDRDPAPVAEAEILLDRAHVSPGEIDGLDGDNFRNAVRVFQQVNGLPVSADLDAATWGALKRDGAPVLKAYTITLADAAGPFTRAIPSGRSGRPGCRRCRQFSPEACRMPMPGGFAIGALVHGGTAGSGRPDARGRRFHRRRRMPA
jgi:Putative peptidoglycan binding domain